AGAPSVAKRIEAMAKLHAQGWLLGLRFDPLIYTDDFRRHYRQLFEQVFKRINPESLHSVSLGVFRLPESNYKKMHKLYPEEKLFAGPLVNQQGMVSYRQDLEQEMMDFCSEQLLNYIPEDKFFPCRL
ncbi:MAG TPA: DNA photolyase, partial [Methylococcaceae bacterium]|nr:DNA photolyase [Methylococcaceae bacterium]